jgi:hypothetical protein
MEISALGLLVVFERQLIAVIRAAIAVLGLFKLLVKRVTATIRAGRVLLTELRLKKSQLGTRIAHYVNFKGLRQFDAGRFTYLRFIV